MFLFKIIGLFIYVIITILFTIGYASQPIVISTSSTHTTKMYLSHYEHRNLADDETMSKLNAYVDIDKTIILIFKILFYLCICVTVLLSGGIILSSIGLTFISKMLFTLALFLMICVFIIMQIIILIKDVVKKIHDDDSEKSNGLGYYLILGSTCLMIVNSIMFFILA